MNVIVKAVAGSRLYGLSRPDSDTDLRGVFIDPTNTLIGLQPCAETFEVPGPGDEVLYPLKKFANLALAGNPNALELLFTPYDWIVEKKHEWAQLYQLRHCFLSQKLRPRYAGFMHSQIELVMRRKSKPNTTHQKFVDAFGYDTKSAAHCIRVGLAALSLVKDMDFDPTLKDDERALVRDVLGGVMPQERFETLAKSMLDEIRNAKSPLPEEPHVDAVKEVVSDILYRYVRNDFIHGLRVA